MLIYEDIQRSHVTFDDTLSLLLTFIPLLTIGFRRQHYVGRLRVLFKPTKNCLSHSFIQTNALWWMVFMNSLIFSSVMSEYKVTLSAN